MPIARAGEIEEDQLVVVRLKAYNFLKFGPLHGEVATGGSREDGNSLLIRVDFKNGLVTTSGNQIGYLHDMTGTGDIVVSHDSFLLRVFRFFRYR